MLLFQKINEHIYRLELSDTEAPVFLVKGKTNFLVNCGGSDKTVDYVIVPALKKLGQSLKSIHGVVFTECSGRTSGGAHRLHELLSGAKFYACGREQADRLRNPTFYESTMFSVCPDHAPPENEIRGIFVDGEVDVESRMFEELLPVSASGHSPDGVCWHHRKTKTLICGDNIQGGGTERTGVAVITDKEAYKASLEELSELDEVESLLCSSGIKEVPERVQGMAQCRDVINNSIAISDGYARFAQDYINSRRAQQLSTTLEELTYAYFSAQGYRPQFQGYAMLTFNEYIL